jgi:hypothetical protein
MPKLSAIAHSLLSFFQQENSGVEVGTTAVAVIWVIVIDEVGLVGAAIREVEQPKSPKTIAENQIDFMFIKLLYYCSVSC